MPLTSSRVSYPNLFLTLLSFTKHILGDSVTNCVYDTDCLNETDICQYGSCVPDVPCKFNVECQNGICHEDQCVWKPCRFKNDCYEGQSCGKDDICSPTHCQSRLDCPRGQTCNRLNQCDHVECWNDGECPVDMSCQYGQCITVSCVTGSSICSPLARICLNEKCVRKSCENDRDCRLGSEYCLASYCAIDPGCRLCSNGSETHDDWSSLPDQSRKIGASLGNVLLEKDNNISGCQSSQVCQNEVGILHSCVQGKCMELICDNQGDCPSHHTCYKGICIYHGKCQLSNDCHPQAICTKGHCHFLHCNLHSDCSKGFLCSQEFQCVPNKCQTKKDCPPNFLCHENGHCEMGGCVDEVDCAPLGDCIEGHCQELKCTDDSQCQPHRICLEGFCVLGPCQTENECQEEEVCLKGYCVPDPLCICPDDSDFKDPSFKQLSSVQHVQETH